jgi:hypothetical protein
MELGKDVIAIDPDGVPCAYQLKTPSGKRLSLHEWTNGINQQVYNLVTLKSVHTSLPPHKHHRSFLVTNRGIEEEVMRAIKDLNQQWADSGSPHLKLETIVGGEIYQDAIKLGTNLWPLDLVQVRTLLELFLHDGLDQLPREKLANLLETTMGLKEENKTSTRAESIRACSSGAVLCALATKSFSEKNNHFAQIEAWVMYLVHVLAVCERRKIKRSLLKGPFNVGLSALRNAIANLVDDLMKRTHIEEGDFSLDKPFQGVRLTYLLAILSIHVLWSRSEGTCDQATETFARAFSKKYRDQMDLWGEGAVPLILAFYWYWRTYDASPEAHAILVKMIHTICHNNSSDEDEKENQTEPIPNPYYCAVDVLTKRFGFPDAMGNDDFLGSSYSLEALVHLFVRQNWRQPAKLFWPAVTKIWFHRFDPRDKWRLFLWKTGKGTHWSVHPKLNHTWKALSAEASECKGKSVPASIRDIPHLFMLFLCVYPHRLNAENVRWLDSALSPS